MVNFLRLGDILMMAPIVEQIRRQYPSCEIHYLIFEEFKVATQVLSRVDRWHFLSRAQIRQSMESLDESLLDSADVLQDLIEKLNSENFDLVVSLSHTLATSYLVTLVEAPQKLGAYFSENRVVYSSQGFQRLDQSETNSHYLDRYREALGLTSAPVLWNFDSQSKPKRSQIAIQAISSDEKKGWTAENWKLLVDLIRLEKPEMNVVFLCAPFEKEEVQGVLGSEMDVRGVSLREAMDIIEESQVFLTLDTSTKHLANGTQTPVVELFFGSGDFRKQAIYKPDSILIVPKTSCYPCSSEKICPLAQRQCASDIDPLDVMKVLLKDQSDWGRVTSTIYRTKTETGVWKLEENKNEDRKKIRKNTREEHSEVG